MVGSFQLKTLKNTNSASWKTIVINLELGCTKKV